MRSKPHIGIFVDWYLPGFKAGGPIRSVANLVDRLHGDIDFSIVTSDRDLHMNSVYDGITPNQWTERDNCRVMYLSPENRSYSELKQIILASNFDTIYLNSLFSVRFSLFPLLIGRSLGVRTILAPRGMLGRGALRLKPLKKKVFLSVFRLMGLHHKVLWHATAETEREEVTAVFGSKLNLFVAPNLTELNMPSPKKEKKLPGRLRLFFLSRISPKKNLEGALKVLGATNGENDIIFTIIGPIEDQGYWELCKQLIDNLPKHISVHFKGELPHQEVIEEIGRQEVMLFPTHNENFGHVIVEAWRGGCPVILSDQTPWKDLENKYLGKVHALSETTNFVRSVDTFAAMGEDEFAKWTHSCIGFAEELSKDDQAVGVYREIFMNT